jgi:hypothetical protein
MSAHEPPGQRIALMPAVANPCWIAGSSVVLVTSYQLAIFMPISWSVTAGPALERLTVTVLAGTAVTVTVAVAVAVTGVPVLEVTVSV